MGSFVKTNDTVGFHKFWSRYKPILCFSTSRILSLLQQAYDSILPASYYQSLSQNQKRCRFDGCHYYFHPLRGVCLTALSTKNFELLRNTKHFQQWLLLQWIKSCRRPFSFPFTSHLKGSRKPLLTFTGLLSSLISLSEAYSKNSLLAARLVHLYSQPENRLLWHSDY